MLLNEIITLTTWWKLHYIELAHYDLNAKQTLGSPKNKICRFCGKKEPETQFRKIAHAIPESLGNRSLFSYYECDDCNHIFGNTIEDHLNKFLFPYRIASGITGKKPDLTYKHPKHKGNKIVASNTNYNWTVKLDGEAELLSQIDDHTIQINTTRFAYIPIMVYKALVKMAISIMPESEITNFTPTLKWLQSDKKTDEDLFGKYVIWRIFSRPLEYIKVSLFKRREEVSKMPAYQFSISFSNYYLQIIVPCLTKDLHLDDKHFCLKAIPHVFDFIPEPKCNDLLDLSSHEQILPETIPFQMQYKTIEKCEMQIIQS